MNQVVRVHPKHGLLLERVQFPDGDHYQVVVDGDVTFSSRVESAAMLEYDEMLAERRRPGLERLERERATGDFFQHRAATWAAKAGRDSKKGGRGVGR